MGLIRVVNVSKSIVHISSPSTVMQKGAGFVISESDLNSNAEILGAISAGILEKRSLDDGENKVDSEAETEIIEPSIKPEKVESEDANDDVDDGVIFTEKDLNSEPVSNDAYVRTEDRIVRVDPSTAETVDEEAEEKAGTREFVDGIEIINPVVEKTRKIDGVEIVIEEGDDDEYSSAFIESD